MSRKTYRHSINELWPHLQGHLGYEPHATFYSVSLVVEADAIHVFDVHTCLENAWPRINWKTSMFGQYKERWFGDINGVNLFPDYGTDAGIGEKPDDVLPVGTNPRTTDVLPRDSDVTLCIECDYVNTGTKLPDGTWVRAPDDKQYVTLNMVLITEYGQAGDPPDGVAAPTAVTFIDGQWYQQTLVPIDESEVAALVAD
jgi:hypothetical protein